MTWVLPRHDSHQVFERNPIASSIVQLRFHPILKIRDHIADFQEALRRRFPHFMTAKTQEVEIELPGNVRVSEQEQFRFSRDDKDVVVTLSPSALAIENRKHRHHQEFLGDFDFALQTLLRLYDSVAPIRLGMRYINIIRRDTIARDLGKEVEWSGLVRDGFLTFPGNLATLDRTRFANELTSPLADGEMTLRYGILPNPGNDGTHFRLDIDRYVQAEFDPAQTLGRLNAFSDDIYALFISAAGEVLLKWMMEEGE